LLGAFNANVDVPNYANNGSPLYVNRNPRKGMPYFSPNYYVPETIGQVGNAMRRSFSGPGKVEKPPQLLGLDRGEGVARGITFAEAM
jgi:hypothetical protein